MIMKANTCGAEDTGRMSDLYCSTDIYTKYICNLAEMFRFARRIKTISAQLRADGCEADICLRGKR